MKKTLSLILALVTVFSVMMCMSAPASAYTDAEVKKIAADYIGTSADSLSNYKCEVVKVTVVSLGGLTLTADQYEITFRFNGISYKISVDSAGLIRNYSYESKKLLIPKGESGLINESEARAKALNAAGVSSSDAIFTSTKFVVEDYAEYYTYEFLGKTQEVTAKVNASTKNASPEISATEKNAFIMFFTRLFAKISQLFG
ncbi:MAG: hypothetical protein J5562_00090 [Clostridia bacterium]|nr:hypothetical protein [Clostridia bacterium]